MIAIAFLVGTLIVGMVIYSATIERQREYGVLKAMGAHNAILYRTVVAQALVVASVGALMGVGLAAGIAQLIMALRPQFLIVLEPAAIVGTALGPGHGVSGGAHSRPRDRRARSGRDLSEVTPCRIALRNLFQSKVRLRSPSVGSRWR